VGRTGQSLSLKPEQQKFEARNSNLRFVSNFELRIWAGCPLGQRTQSQGRSLVSLSDTKVSQLLVVAGPTRFVRRIFPRFLQMLDGLFDIPKLCIRLGH